MIYISDISSLVNGQSLVLRFSSSLSHIFFCAASPALVDSGVFVPISGRNSADNAVNGPFGRLFKTSLMYFYRVYAQKLECMHCGRGGYT